MPPFLKFLIRRLLVVPSTLFIVTAALYGIALLAPPESRAWLYWPRNVSLENISAEEEQRILQKVIESRGLADPYPVQYVRWVSQLLQGDWGYSPTIRVDILEYLLARTPTTVELTLYSVLLFIPLGLISGVIAGWKRNRPADHGFRMAAFVGASIPPFILALVLLSIFYVGLGWFPLGRLGTAEQAVTHSAAFQRFTGLITLDGLLNGRPDIALNAWHHLALPVFTLSLAQWATLGRVTRASMIEELGKEYIVSAYGKGLKTRAVIWGHALRNALVPALTASTLSAAGLITGVYVVEVVFGLHGVSDLIQASVQYGYFYRTLDIAPAMGLAAYSILAVTLVMFVLDVLQAVVDPRIRERLAGG